MENLGALAILMAFCMAIYAAMASAVGRARHKPFLVVSGARAVYAVWGLITLASAILVHALLTGDFRFAYVAEHSNRAMPILYKFAAWWGGQEGSLLFWSWLLSTYAAVVVFTNRRKHRDMMPWVVAVLATVQTFFLLMNNFVANAFQMLAVDKLITSVPDGNGLSPLLQYPAMAIHPPMLYLGYVGFAVPFAFAIRVADHQATRRCLDPHHAPLDAGHLAVPKLRHHAGRGVGLSRARMGRLLGLGSGGERFAAALAQRHGFSAFGHDAGKERHDEGLEHRADLGDLLPVHLRHLHHARRACRFGARLRAVVRSASISSPSWPSAIAAMVWLILDRLEYLKSESQLESVVSRESSFLFNNLILLASCFAVLWGTLFPKISEVLHRQQDLARFRLVQPPDGAHRPVLCCSSPASARCSPGGGLRSKACGAISRFRASPAVVLGRRAVRRGDAQLLCAGFVRLVPVRGADGAGGVLQGRARHRRQEPGMNLLRAAVELTHRNTRRYGGYLVHMGIVLMFIGFTGHAFNQSDVKELNVGDSMRMGGYDLKMIDLKQGENDNYALASRHHGGLQERRTNRARSSRKSASTKPAARALPKWACACGPTRISTSISAACPTTTSAP